MCCCFLRKEMKIAFGMSFSLSFSTWFLLFIWFEVFLEFWEARGCSVVFLQCNLWNFLSNVMISLSFYFRFTILFVISFLSPFFAISLLQCPIFRWAKTKWSRNTWFSQCYTELWNSSNKLLHEIHQNIMQSDISFKIYTEPLSTYNVISYPHIRSSRKTLVLSKTKRKSLWGIHIECLNTDDSISII